MTKVRSNRSPSPAEPPTIGMSSSAIWSAETTASSRRHMEIGQIKDRLGDEGEVAAQETDRHNRALAPPFGGDFARGGAADDGRHAEAARNFGGERRRVVVGRDENEKPGQVIARKLARDFRRRRVRALAPRRRGDHAAFRRIGKAQMAILHLRLKTGAPLSHLLYHKKAGAPERSAARHCRSALPLRVSGGTAPRKPALTG